MREGGMKTFVREMRPSGLPTKEWGWVYLVICLPTGKRYVGVTGFSVRRRWRRHCNRADADRPRNGNCPALHAAIRKYGEDAFTCEAIYAGMDWQATLDAECALIVALESKAPGGYNVTDGGEGVRGKVSEERRHRLATQNIGRKASEEAKRLRSVALTGRRLSEFQKEKLRNRIFSVQHRSNISKAKKGHKFSDDVRSAMSAGHMGIRPGVETRAKMSAWQIGKKLSEETKIKIREAALARSAAKRVAA